MPLTNIRLPHTKILEYSNVKANWYYVQILKRMLRLIGLDFTVADYTPFNAPLLLLIFVSHSILINYKFLLISDLPLRAKLEATCLALIIYEAIHKLYAAIFNSEYYFDMLKVVRELHMKYENDMVVAPLLKQICFYCAALMELLFFLYYTLAFAYLIWPIFSWGIYGELKTIFPMQFPYLDWHTPIGYVVNTIHHLLTINMGAIGSLAADNGFVYLVLHTIGYRNILKLRISQLDDLLESVTRDLQKIEKKFYECVQAHQEYITFIGLLDDRYAILCLSQVASSELLLTLALFLTVWSKWVIGPFMVIAGLFQLVQYCVLGTVVTVQNEKISDMIYDMKWYFLPVHLQKNVVLMIMRGQSSPELNVGSFAKLNVETCMQVLKATYSYLMMMLEFIK